MSDRVRQEPGGLASKPFDGIRFILLGFDYDSESEVRLKLVSGGGEDIGNYSQECTHVIVDKCVYDHPTCVAARTDGKIVVTGLWVDHSYDIGLPVDHASVIYKPLRDLNGIPGAKHFVICLTGYTRQDREDIMIMVGLMGAQFSKPLVASKATHLICYKFEGEKYELAKKLPKIRIVNHTWLEDCLSSWELLPEANYAKSGYELEMEVEAKDTEEEEIAEGSITKQFNGRTTDFSSDSRMRNGEQFPTLTPIQAMSKIPIVPAAIDGHSCTEMSKVSINDNRETLTPAQHNNNTDHVIDYTSSMNAVKHEHSNQSPKPMDSKEEPVSIYPEIVEKSNFIAPTPWKEKKNALSGTSSSFGSAKKLSNSGSKSSHAVTYATKTSSRLSLRKDLLGETGNYVEQLVKFRNLDALASVSQTELKKVSSDTKTSSPMEKAIVNVRPSKRKLDSTFDGTRASQSSRGSKCPIEYNDNFDVSSLASGIITINRSSPGRNMDNPESHNLNDSSEEIIVPKHDIVTSSPGLMPAKSTNPRNVKLSTGDTQKSVPKRVKFVGYGKSSGACLNLEAVSPCSDTWKSEDQTNLNLLNSENGNLKSTPGRRKGLVEKVSGSSLNSGLPSHSAEFGKFKETDMLVEESHKPKEKPIGKRIHGDSVGTRLKSVAIAISKKSSVEGSTKEDNGETHDSFHKFSNTKEVYSAIDALPIKRVDGEFIKGLEGMGGPSDKEAEAQEGNGESRAKTTKSVTKDMEMENDMQQRVNNGSKNTIQTLSFRFVAENNVNVKEKCSLENELDNGALKVDGKTRKTHKGKILNRKSGKQAKAAASIKKMGHSRSEMITAENKDQLGVGSMYETNQQPPHSNAQNHVVDANKIKTVPETEKEDMPLPDDAEDGNTDEMILQPSKSNSKKHADDANELKNIPKSVKEKRPLPGVAEDSSFNKKHKVNTTTKSDNTPLSLKRNASVIRNYSTDKVTGQKLSQVEQKVFILSGHWFERKEFKKILRQLKGRFCRDSHHWSYQATHFIVPDPKRTEKFFAAAASGRWILKANYLTESLKAGRFLEEEPYEWNTGSPGQVVGKVDLVAPRIWRMLREQTGHGAFHGMRIIVYGDFFSPPLDTLKRAVKAGDGMILATAPPYTRFLNSRVDYAVISQGMPKMDVWVQELLKHEIPCVLIEYLVEFVCNPGSPLNKHVLFETELWAEKSFAYLVRRSKEIVDGWGTEEE